VSYTLQIEDYPGIVRDKGKFESYEDALEAGIGLFREGELDDFIIADSERETSEYIYGYQLMEEECPICGKKVMRKQMERTHDCHGIPFRLVCAACYDRLMEYPGYDGEYYTELDENIEEDW